MPSPYSRIFVKNLDNQDFCDILEEFPKYGQMSDMRMAPSENIETQFQINMTFISEDRGSCEQTLNYTLLMSD